jgi:hypothetical protein
MEGIGKFFRRQPTRDARVLVHVERSALTEQQVAEPARPGVSPGDRGAAVDGTPAVDRAPTGRPDEATSGELARGTDSPRRPVPDPVDFADCVPGPAPPDQSRSDSELRKHNRATRRKLLALERARMKFDRWVEPKGELPAPKPRAPRADPIATPDAPEPTTAADFEHLLPNDPGEIAWYDKIDGQDVLFLERESYGTFHFRDTILDQLELYWVYLRRMKKNDIDAYETYKRLGATILPPARWFLHDGIRTDSDDEADKKIKAKQELSAWWKQNRPAFGCVSYGLTPRVEAYENNPPLEARTEGRVKSWDTKRWNVWFPKFLHFTKYKVPPPDVQPTTNGDVYAVTVYWDRPNDVRYQERYHTKGGTPQEFPIYISHDGKDVHVLKKRETFRTLPKNVHNRTYHHGGKKGRKKRHAGESVKVFNTWHYEEAFVEWATRHHSDVDTFLCNLFLDTARAFEDSGYGMARVEVHNGDLTAVFSLDPRRMAYFFKDRDITLTKEGRRERIFHLVKPHTRTARDGSLIYVPFTFRGLREFEWAGYRVKITIPGRDHFRLHEYDVGVLDLDSVDSEDKSDMLTAGESAELLRGWIDDGVLGNVRAKSDPNK